VGDYLDMVSGVPARIKEIGPEATIIDLNHPLAGKTVTFDLKVLDVRQPKL
jgi:FKBP-type peptidyl-prolyl cis-trans isomerase SlyD